ncbi:MAG: peptidylprolyl isomerase [Anaerolineae bacterium]|nr:peptidylprolyl isomerase [Anaerolineae bacterium]
MENKPQPQKIEDDVVVSLDYTLFIDGQEVDSSKDTGPIHFIQGLGNIIPGLENELYDMTVGDEKSLDIKAEDAYGEIDEEAIIDIPRSEFPADLVLKPGAEIEIESQEGERYAAIILEATDEKVVLDFNHPLAGKNLVFEIKIVGLRNATEEELEHGHAHDPSSHSNHSI